MTRSLNEASSHGASITARAPGRNPSPRRRQTVSNGTLIFGSTILVALVWGWANRAALPTAESGVSYYLGIVGAVGMLALLAYPLRKHAGFLRRAGPVSYWFRAHMALGLIGPTLILFHARFGLGSLNSNVALWSMLIVAGSGLVGRFIYAKIHKGLYGVRAEMRDLASDATEFRRTISRDIDSALSDSFDKIEKAAFADAPGFLSAAGKAFSVTASARSLHGVVRRRLRKKFDNAHGSARRELRDHLDFCNRYFRRVEQAAELGLYERLFSAWHLLHLPLFILLIITAIIHVVAVHLY